MESVKVSPKFQIVIPKALRERLKLRPGQRLFIYAVGGSLRLDPPCSVKELRGLAKGLKWKGDYRDHTERF
jgi:AbrB family looped-hinge helix DNA binding protein